MILHIPSDKIIGRGHNRRESDADPTAHAEILALREAAATMGSWRLAIAPWPSRLSRARCVRERSSMRD